MFVRIKNIGKKGKRYSYFYLVQSYWDKRKQSARQKVILYMGKVEGLKPYIVNGVFKRDGAKCLNCSRQDTLTIDHITPLINNGTNDIDNLQVLCMKCNQKKGRKTINYIKQTR